MRQHKRKLWRASMLALAGLASLLVSCSEPPPSPSTTPIIFVNGYLGSGGQYRAQAMRFASNGYPADRISAFDYNLVATGLDAYVDSIRTRFNVSKVHLVGHSLGTVQLNDYMDDTTQAAKVDKFVLIDGFGCPWGNAQCLAISASSLPAVGGGNQTHVEASVSPESFAKQYQFFLGKAPTTTAILPEPNPKISGKLLELQENTPIVGTPLQLWQVDAATGRRVGGSPVATGTTTADGSFGPYTVDGNKHYEIAAARPGGPVFHYYYQPFVRSTSILRLNSLASTSGTSTNTNRGPNHSALAVVRYREFWTNHGANDDRLTVKAGSQPATDVFANVDKDVVGVHIHDNGTPGTSSLSVIPYFGSQFFQTGVDVFIPATTPPTQTVTVTNTPRGDASKSQTVNVPNWASSNDVISIDFNDWVQ